MLEALKFTIINLCSVYYGTYYNIDPALIRSIIKVESSHKTTAVSNDGHDLGLMQIRYKYHKYIKRNKLFDTCSNISLGTLILKESKDRCKHTKDYTYVVCYNVGIKGGNNIKNPRKFNYYKKVMEEYGREKFREVRGDGVPNMRNPTTTYD